MQNPASSPARDESGLFGHPRGLTNLFFTELWERFGYYGMRALLTLFMVAPLAKGGLGFDNRTAGIIYGTYTMSVYMLSIPGGYIADNFLGARATVFWGGVIIAAGYLSLAVHSQTFFYLGLVLVACGTGLLKPNISSMVGSLYTKDDPRRDSGFSIFYMGINTGALVAPLITGWVAQSDMAKEFLANQGFDPNKSWHWAFAISGIGMIVGLITYVLQRHRLADVGHAPSADIPRPWGKLLAVLAASALVFWIVRLSDSGLKVDWGIMGKTITFDLAWISYSYVIVPVLAIIWFGTRPDPAQKRMAAVFVFALAYLIFCAIFEQAGSTISLFADQLTRTEIAGFAFPSSWFQSVNSIFVILLSPVFAFVWVKWGDRIPSPIKFSFGLFFLALSFVLMVPAAKLTIDGRISPMWLVGLFFLQTVGELALSPVGLSTMTKLAPANLVGLVMGVWFLAAALGNKLAGTVAGDFTSTDPNALSNFFLHQAGWVGLAFVALLALTPWVKKLMGEVK